MTLIRDLIDIPERVHRDDFVLRLAEGVTNPAETLRTYVVTPQLADAFDRALDLIKGALASGSSKAAYLHGSFGSGKSHFMAVLHLLLQQDAAARATEGLEGVVTQHDNWLADKRFLLVPYHMIGKPSLEAAVLGGYAARVAELHPDAPAPGSTAPRDSSRMPAGCGRRSATRRSSRASTRPRRVPARVLPAGAICPSSGTRRASRRRSARRRGPRRAAGWSPR